MTHFKNIKGGGIAGAITSIAIGIIIMGSVAVVMKGTVKTNNHYEMHTDYYSLIKNLNHHFKDSAQCRDAFKDMKFDTSKISTGPLTSAVSQKVSNVSAVDKNSKATPAKPKLLPIYFDVLIGKIPDNRLCGG